MFGGFRVAPQQVYGRPDWDLILKGFVDFGFTERHVITDSAGNRVEEADEELLGVGVGVEFRLKHSLTVRADWGRALRSTASVPRGNNEFHFLISILY
jgi:hemolysin activation/secretion protein